MTAARLSARAVYPDSEPGTDGIGDYTERLVAELRSSGGVEAARASPDDLSGPAARCGVPILQYSPFSFGRRGFAPALLMRWLRLGRPKVIMVHEPYVPIHDARTFLMSVWQRGQLAALVHASDRIFISAEAWRDRLPRTRRAAAVHLPVPSTLPLAHHGGQLVRASLGIPPEAMVMATLSSGHPSQLTPHVVAAARAVAEAGHHGWLLNLGARASELGPVHSEITVERPGHLAPADLAEHIAAADLFLVPFVDGASTRRTSVMAGLQQNVTVISTDGELTDPIFRTLEGTAWRLTAAHDLHAYVDVAVQLASSPEDRSRIAAAGRKAYTDAFDWPTVRQRIIEELAPCAS